MNKKKKVLYEIGPDEIEVGMVGKMQRGVPVDLDEHIADLLLKKPMFKEFKEATTKTQRHEEKK